MKYKSTNYKRGATFERKVQSLLEEQGWNTLRAAGSHGCYDVIAWDKQSVRFIQCKIVDKEVDIEKHFAKEIEQIRSVQIPYGHFRELWVRIKRQIYIMYIYDKTYTLAKYSHVSESH